MSTDPPIVVWFRQDLRLADNPALSEAAASGRPVIALYILDDSPGVRAAGAASRWWLEKSLTALAADLASLGGMLVLKKGAARRVLGELIAETGADRVHWNRLYDAGSVARDMAIKADLAAAVIECRSFNASLLNEPWEIKSAAGGSYRVFTPYWRAARQTAGRNPPVARPTHIRTPAKAPRSDRLADWRLHPTRPDWSSGFGDWAPGEKGARRRLEVFLDEGVRGYAKARDRPAAEGTSRLSPHLHFGEIGPRQIWAGAQTAVERGQASERAAESFLRELGWREFNHHILFHHPEMATKSLNGGFEAFPWRSDPAGLDAWRRGATGFPIVDAGMRQLWSTGWMHNRVRMIVASFLVKDLLIDWRDGEAWFWDTLVDADPANNVGNWQWVAGSGADAAPYFRIFNPTLQGETFDPAGDYIRRWVPKLARLPAPFVHQPSRAGRELLGEAGVDLGVTYPVPILAHKAARACAMEAYRSLSNADQTSPAPSRGRAHAAR
ncbi:MAG: cryptochrome/photolyase family protein [Caulobacteraceae bacterium]